MFIADCIIFNLVYWKHLNKCRCLNFLVEVPTIFDIGCKSNLKKLIDEFPLFGIFGN